MSKKVFIVGGGAGGYDQMFKAWGWQIVNKIEEASLVQFTGGSDVTPAFYGEKNTKSWCNEDRDYKEQKFFHYCIEHGLPMTGICRGGQFLNVMNGGRMRQHVDGHAIGSTHKAYDYFGAKFVEVTSTHHQMMVPHPDANVLMTAQIVGDDDIEALFYERTNCLCFQPHPEFLDKDHECQRLYFQYIETLLGL